MGTTTRLILNWFGAIQVTKHLDGILHLKGIKITKMILGQTGQSFRGMNRGLAHPDILLGVRPGCACLQECHWSGAVSLWHNLSRGTWDDLSLIARDGQFDHWVKVAPARFLHCEVISSSVELRGYILGLCKYLISHHSFSH